ncbi:MAG: YqaJ viral recombinase family protein [Elusimicrobia bacterium]|nr:YqaJ viral recombinase family protein [Elusimicrobiota bacterium]
MKNHKIKQRSDEWFHLRKGKITGTTLKAIMGTPKARQEAIYEMIAQRLTVGIKDETENAMDRGLRLEDDAVAAFELESGKKVEKMGLCEEENNPLVCNSPDGLIGKNEAIEVKCMGGKNHVKLWLENEIPDEYKWQVIQYFIVNEKLEKLYFVGYNPDIPVHLLHIIEIKREKIEDEIQEAKKKQRVFLAEIEKILSAIIKL